jgi:hypothetical protein
MHNEPAESFPDWATEHEPEDTLGMSSAEGCREWISDRLYEYAYWHEGVTWEVVIEALQMMLHWAERGQQAAREQHQHY